MLYPVLNSSRTLIDLSGIWSFKADDGTGFQQQWYANKLKNPMTMAVPASYNDQKESIDLRDHYGYVFYQREIAIPKTLEGQRIVLRFGAVTHYAKVYLNGQLITEHKGGFLPFEVEIQDKVKSQNNLLTVAVNNVVDYSTLPVGSEVGGNMLGGVLPPVPGVTPKKQNAPNFDFFNYAGIHRPVKIYSTPKKFIEDITIVPSLEGTKASVYYKIDTIGQGETTLTIYDEEREVVAEAKGNEGTFIIENVHLWQPLNAYLYAAEITFGEDRYEQSFGVRTVEVKDSQFLINGKPFYFKGFGKHEDFIAHGRGLDEVLNVKDLSLLRWIGANSFRTSHYPYSEEMMNLCDREGFVVIDETPAVGVNVNFGAMSGGGKRDTFEVLHTHQHHHDVVVDMIERDKNHPCIVMWSIANESDTTAFPESSYNYYKPLYDLAHKVDPQNRPVTIVGVQGEYKTDKTLPAMDVICLNRYYGWYIYGGDLNAAKQALSIELDYWKTIGKPIIFTEYGADTVAGLHLATPTMFTEEYQVEFLRANHEIFDKYDCFVGEHVWNFADFQTIQGIMRVEGNKKGAFTRDRRPKLAAHYLQNRWTQIPDFEYK
ncbi:glycoside hydrolase family 2 TIM barrel [Ruminiclostridium cellulolyticum H10]|uniref:Beta-glucuronidase n=2 Tax=Ruminiclostridium cellulolyticum TaxID=1521 RepID=B8I2M8_RUMCH|nr:beta-glucuronidase [Ruminiclostridium cellulolyticum]ACL76021.1 glycoside hydrolase family 2 TIM barrel [Ruminiclostridium cellulolyticum H10]